MVVHESMLIVVHAAVMRACTIALVIFRFSFMYCSQSTSHKRCPLLYQQLFWPKSNFHHVNQRARLFVRRSIELLEADTTQLMVCLTRIHVHIHVYWSYMVHVDVVHLYVLCIIS